MGKSGRQANNARLAALKAEQARQERQRKVLLAAGTVGLVLLIVGALVIAKLTSADTPAVAAKPLDQATYSKLTKVPATSFDAVGAGTSGLTPKKIDGEVIKDGDKPRVLYVGGEFCPYCALERYPVLVALSRFGDFSNLGTTNSDAADNNGVAIDTVSFHGATYTSKYLSFLGAELTDNKKVNGQYGRLDTLSAADQSIFDKFNAPPYTDPPGGAIPWVYFGGKAITVGAGIDKALIEGKTQAQVAESLADPKSDVAQAVLGHANVITAQICQLTNQQPADVCGSSGVKAGAAKLG